MTKKDYELIAQCFANQLSDITPEGRQTITIFALHVTNQLELNNSKFDRERFLLACGVTK